MKPRLHIPHSHLEGYNREYEENVRSDLEADEPERRRRVLLGLILAVISIPPCLWLAWYFGFAINEADTRAVHIAYLGPFAVYVSFIASLRRRTKRRLMQSITNFLNWSHSEGEDQTSLVRRLAFFGLLPDHDNIRVGDVLQGTHENWPFEICEVSLFKIEGWGENRRSVLKFKGVVLTFDLGRVSEAITILTRDRMVGHPKLANFIKHEGIYTDHLGEVIVRSSDIYAVETAMCDRFRAIIQDLTTSLPNINVSCFIDRHHLHLPLQERDRFEMDYMFDAMGTTHRVQKLLNEFSEVLTLLDIVLRRRACPKTGSLDYPKFRKI